jgi:uncharacterized protein (AIM24 family)
MDSPRLLPSALPSAASSETFGGVSYRVDGELVPVLTVELQSENAVYFEHHILLWKSPEVELSLRTMKGAARRMIAGTQIFVTEASGPGEIAFSRDGAGQILSMHLPRGRELHVREHQFLAATAEIEYAFERVKGVANMLFGGTGFFVDRFRAGGGDGVLWIHGYGNVFEKELDAGEQIDVEPGAWLYKDATVKMETNIARLTTGLLAGVNLAMNRFTGPGRIGVQSMYMNIPTDD